MCRNRLALLLLLFWLACHASAVPVRSETRLRWKFKPGEVLQYDFRQGSKTEASGAGKPTSVALDMAMRLKWTVDKVDPQGVATIRQTIETMSLTMKVDELPPLVYDSSAKPATSGPGKDIADAVAGLIGGQCMVQLTDRGEIVSVEPSPELKKALEKSKAGNIFTPEGLSRIVRQSSIVLPESPIEPTTKWQAVQETPSPLGTLRVTNQFEYAGPEPLDGTKYDRINAIATIELPAAKNQAGADLTLKESTQSGTLWFDAGAGRFTKSEFQQRLVTERPYREFTIRVKTSNTMEMKLVP